MVLCLRATDITFIKSLYRLINIFALIPPYTELRGSKLIAYNIYAIFLIITCTSAYVNMIYVNIAETYPIQNRTTCVVGCLSTTIQIGSLMIAIIRSTFHNGSRYRRFNKLFKKIDKCMNSNNIPSQTCYAFYTEIIITHIVMVPLLICNAFLDYWLILVPTLEFYFATFGYVLMDFAKYLNMMTILLIYNYIEALRHRFKRINKKLQSTIQHTTGCQFSVSLRVKAEANPIFKKVCEARELFTKLSELVDIFNLIFGWQILFLCASSGITVLELVNAAITLAVASVTILGWEINLYALGVSWFIVYTVMIILIAVVCQRATNEIRRTPVLCYEILLNFPAISNNSDRRILREELILFAQQASLESPNFSAAGFFGIGYTMLFGLVGTVTSYIIVLVEINQ